MRAWVHIPCRTDACIPPEGHRCTRSGGHRGGLPVNLRQRMHACQACSWNPAHPLQSGAGLTSAPSHSHAARRSASMSLGSLPRFSGWPPATPASPTGPVGGGPGGDGAAENDDSEESVEAVENLLESYFMQIDASYDRLVSIGALQAGFSQNLTLTLI